MVLPPLHFASSLLIPFTFYYILWYSVVVFILSGSARPIILSCCDGCFLHLRNLITPLQYDVKKLSYLGVVHNARLCWYSPSLDPHVEFVGLDCHELLSLDPPLVERHL